MSLHGLAMLSPPASAMHKVQASDTADQQAALETTSSRNWDFPRKLKVLSSILLAILVLFGAFGPGARTCFAVRYVNKMEHSRIGLRAFEKRRIPAHRLSPPDPNRMRSQFVPPQRPPQQRPPPPRTIY
ncbi:hypothetical protein NC653_030782 [Populus alba x Populus x berolinensis]|uniref:Transmembrane protein n=1 Tax=Populus alba x Populus x berolinensis TaxID=444605 RepID=A0AAD6Q0L3_9ROSI|nr:hypothetical protein NC653_030782 [Populus alba x Populus x berolinensis]